MQEPFYDNEIENIGWEGENLSTSDENPSRFRGKPIVPGSGCHLACHAFHNTSNGFTLEIRLDHIIDVRLLSSSIYSDRILLWSWDGWRFRTSFF